MEKLDGKN